jgi:hypothetical protein
MSFIKNIFLSLFVIVFSGCAHHTYYLAEVSGPEETQGEKGGIIYKIPSSQQTEFSLQIRSLGIRNAQETKMLGVRIAYVRGALATKLKETKEWINPADLFVKLESGKKIKPAFVHSKNIKNSLIVLTGVEYDLIELLFPLPSGVAKNMGIFFLHWKVHYGDGKTEEKIASFDRSSSAFESQPEQDAEDKNYPYRQNLINTNGGWQVDQDDPYWWGYDPYWPWGFSSSI